MAKVTAINIGGKKMYKRISRIILVVFMFTMLFSGCGKKEPAEAVKSTAPTPTATTSAAPKNVEVILATTTSTQDSGLLDFLLPEFEKKTGYKVKTIAVGSGQALEMGKRGEADVLLTHAPASEKTLVDNKEVINYSLVAHNDFIVVGPAEDPAGLKGIKNAADAFKAISSKNAVFISRGDNSGTHKKELEIWKKAGIEKPAGTWYQESSAGMGQTLMVANDKAGYTLTDRATYLSQKSNLKKMEILNEGSKELLNIYHVMQVNPEKFSKVNAEGAKAFVDFMINPETQKMIGTFGKEKYGQPLFIPDAGKDEKTL